MTWSQLATSRSTYRNVYRGTWRVLSDVATPPPAGFALDDDADLWARWTFEDDAMSWGSTNAQIRDVTGNGRHLGAYGGLTSASISAGKVGARALTLNGANSDRANSGAFTGGFAFTPATMCCLVKASGTASQNIIGFYSTASSTPNIFLRIISGQFLWGARSDSGTVVNVQTTETYNNDQWHHIAWVHDAGTGRLYVDGVLKLSPSFSSSLTTTVNMFGIGARFGYPGTPVGNYLTGSVDDIRVYSRALTGEEIATLSAWSLA